MVFASQIMSRRASEVAVAGGNADATMRYACLGWRTCGGAGRVAPVARAVSRLAEDAC